MRVFLAGFQVARSKRAYRHLGAAVVPNSQPKTGGCVVRAAPRIIVSMRRAHDFRGFRPPHSSEAERFFVL